MRTAIFEEYKSAYSDIQATNFDEEAITLITKAVDDVLTAAHITNNDSILALDDYAKKLNKNITLSRFYSELLTMILEGVSPEAITEICIYKLVSYNFNSIEKIAAIIYLLGVLDLQQGTPIATIATTLYALIPLDIQIILEKNNEADRLNKLFPKKTLEEYIASIEEKESPIAPEEEEFFIVNSAEKTIQQLDDVSLKKLLSNITNSDIGIAMKGMSGKSISKILHCLPENLANMLIEDMEFMGAVNNKAIATACHAILLKNYMYSRSCS